MIDKKLGVPTTEWRLPILVLLLMGALFCVFVPLDAGETVMASGGGATPKQTPEPMPAASPVLDVPTASPTASPAASPIASPAPPTEAPEDPPAGPAEPPTASDVAKVEVVLEGGSAAKQLELVEGEVRTVRVKALAGDNTELSTFRSKLTAAKGGVVQIDGEGPEYTLTALGVKNQDSTTVKVEVNDQERPEAEVTVKVLEAVESFESESGTAISIAEGETFTIKFNVKGRQSESLDASAQPFEHQISSELRPFVSVDRDKVQGGYTITAFPFLKGTTGPVAGQISFRAKQGLNNEALAWLVVNLTVREKFGYITFEPPPRGFLLPGGSFTTLAVVRGKEGTPRSDYGVEFTAERETDLRWISLAPEGNKINIYWNDPSEEQITKPDGTKEKRPSQVRIRATARSSTRGQDITGFIHVRMGEVTKFALVKVKLNLMDQVTASDLYGKVMSQEYYVLTVRLFNNLRDDVTKDFTGDSILAYSSSMEVAVGLEKKFNPDSDSEFPNVIGKDAARELARKRRAAAVALANAQADHEIAAANSAQSDLESAISGERTARREARIAREEALNRRDRLIGLESAYKRLRLTANRTKTSSDRKAANNAKRVYDAAYAAAVEATYTANVKIRRAHEAAEDTNRVRASIMRAATNRVAVSQNIMGNSDPDTVIADGRWHPVNPSDFNRIAEPVVPDEDPLPLLPELDADVLSDNIPPRPKDQVIVNEKAREREDPPCRETITYRPFTFEMMVNTVDRRDGRSNRSKLFKILDAIGTGTSFVTSIAVPGNSSDLPLGLEKFGNLLVPGIDKLYPNFKEQNRQNIVAQAMKEIEEIPFGSDITRVIYIPKKTIRGLIRGHDTRISEVCPFYFRIEVAIINKRSTVQQGAIIP